MLIYVLDINGKPLMPTRRAGKVRRMLTDGRAVIAGHTPFTIRLTYNTTHFVQPVALGVDAGSVHVGLSATTDKRELYAEQLELRTDIVTNLSTRREARRTRRSHLRYRAPRFDNRRRAEGSLAPSTEQIINSHIRAVSCKALELVRHNNARLCFALDGTRLIPPPAEAGGILKPIS